MTIDYRKGSPPPRKRGQPRGTCAFWFVVGSVLGAFGVGLAWMTYEQPGGPITAAQPGQASVIEPAAETPPKPKFDFYSLLPEEKVVVPAEEPPQPVPLPPPGAKLQPQPAAPVRQPAPQPTQTAKLATPAPAANTSKNSYILQVGSFRKSADAERLKAELALLGIQTSIQTATIASGQTYHRVRTGTYAKADASAVKGQLKGKGHDAMMMRAK